MAAVWALLQALAPAPGAHSASLLQAGHSMLARATGAHSASLLQGLAPAPAARLVSLLQAVCLARRNRVVLGAGLPAAGALARPLRRPLPLVEAG